MSDNLFYVIFASLALGILLAVFDNWWNNHQARKRRQRRK